MTTDTTTDEDVLTPEQLCVFTGLSFDTLTRYRKERRGPPELVMGRQVRFLRSEVIDWLKSFRAGSGAVVD